MNQSEGLLYGNIGLKGFYIYIVKLCNPKVAWFFRYFSHWMSQKLTFWWYFTNERHLIWFFYTYSNHKNVKLLSFSTRARYATAWQKTINAYMPTFNNSLWLQKAIRRWKEVTPQTALITAQHPVYSFIPLTLTSCLHPCHFLQEELKLIIYQQGERMTKAGATVWRWLQNLPEVQHPRVKSLKNWQ